MPSQPPLGSTGGSPSPGPRRRSPPRPSPAPRGNLKGASSSKGNGKVAGRVFRSSAIVKRHDYTTIETEDGYHIRIGCTLNIPKTRENGFSQEVCECFEFGFPILWQSLVNPKMVSDNEHARSPSETTTSSPSHSVEYYMAKFLSDSFSSSITYDFTENDFYSSVGYSGKTDGFTTESLSNLTDDNAGNIPASWGLYGLRMDVPEKPLAPPGEAFKQSTGSISSNSKVDGNILAPSKISSVVNEGYRSTVGCGQAEKDADIQQENMHSCSGEHGMVTLPIDCTPSQLGEPGIPKCGKASVNLEITDALELPTEGMTPKFGAIGGSEDDTASRLRNGKVRGMPSGGPKKRCHKQKKIQQEESTKQMVNQGATSTVDLTSHENGFSAAEVVVEEKMESHDSRRQGRGRPPKGKGKRKRKWEELGPPLETSIHGGISGFSPGGDPARNLAPGQVILALRCPCGVAEQPDPRRFPGTPPPRVLGPGAASPCNTRRGSRVATNAHTAN